MSIVVTVNNVPFSIPVQGESAPWGESLTEYFIEVARVLNSLKGPSDILETRATILNNRTTFTDIPDFFFNPQTVLSFAVNFGITRPNGSATVEETGILSGYRTDTGWVLQQEGFGNSGVSFDITLSGQVQYKSSNLTGSGGITFRGIGILR